MDHRNMQLSNTVTTLLERHHIMNSQRQCMTMYYGQKIGDSACLSYWLGATLTTICSSVILQPKPI